MGKRVAGSSGSTRLVATASSAANLPLSPLQCKTPQIQTRLLNPCSENASSCRPRPPCTPSSDVRSTVIAASSCLSGPKGQSKLPRLHSSTRGNSYDLYIYMCCIYKTNHQIGGSRCPFQDTMPLTFKKCFAFVLSRSFPETSVCGV